MSNISRNRWKKRLWSRSWQGGKSWSRM